jgi:nitric oxide reductase subunit C
MIVAALVGIVVRAITNEVSPEVSAGYDVWRANGCEGCHTLFGQGGPYAPDLTRIYRQRGETYLREFLVNPSAFYPNQRFMPRFNLAVAETDSLLAFLDWVGQQDAGWPPRAIQVNSDQANAIITNVMDIDQP